MRWLQRHAKDIFWFVMIVGCLTAVRALEDRLFYDPLLNYYRGDFMSMPLPSIQLGKLLLNLSFRYGLNSLLSLAMLYVIFKDFRIVKFSSLLYVAFFVMALLAFVFAFEIFPEEKMLLFYIRRFLIQPLLLLLFIPGFYIQVKGKNNIP